MTPNDPRANDPHAVADPAIQDLLTRVAQRLRRRACFRADDLDDLSQELTVRLLARLDHYDPTRGTFAGYVRGILPNIVRNWLRERAAQKRVSGTLVSLNHRAGRMAEWPLVVDRRRQSGGEEPLETWLVRWDIEGVYAVLDPVDAALVQATKVLGLLGTARAFRVSRHRVRRALDRMREQLGTASDYFGNC